MQTLHGLRRDAEIRTGNLKVNYQRKEGASS